MKKYKNDAERQAAYRERKKKKQELAAEQEDEIALMKRLNLCSFAETASDTPAQTWLEEVQIHRSWLRAFRDIGMDEPDVLPGESLRDLARRTWQALLRSEKFGLGVSIEGGGKWVEDSEGKQTWVSGFDVFYPLFSPSQHHFQVPFDSNRFPNGPFCEVIHEGAQPGWFENNWIPPADCTGDEPIDLKSLQPLPPITVKPKSKSEPHVSPRVDAPIVTGYETPLEEQNRFSGFGTFGITRTSHL
jgi:hypothetical protein